MTEQETLALLEKIGAAFARHNVAAMVGFFATDGAFVNAVGAIAEEQGHHPDLYLSWGMVRIELWTHKINGLTESDFILAAKIGQLIE